MLYVSGSGKTEAPPAGNEILVGEKMATQAELLYGTKYPKEEIHEAVRALLFSEFHDALPGSGTQQVEEDTLRLLDHGLELMSRVNCRSAIALTAGEAPIKEGSSCAFYTTRIRIRLPDSSRLKSDCPNRTGIPASIIREHL